MLLSFYVLKDNSIHMVGTNISDNDRHFLRSFRHLFEPGTYEIEKAVEIVKENYDNIKVDFLCESVLNEKLQYCNS